MKTPQIHLTKEQKKVFHVTDCLLAIFLVVIILFGSCNHAIGQKPKDSIPTPTDTLTAQYRYSMTATVMGYFQQNFKELKISQFEDFQKWLDDIFGKYLASFIKDYEEKKKAIKTISITH